MFELPKPPTMSHGNRNLAIARSRYTLTLASGSGQLVSTKTQTYDADDGTAMERVMSQTWAFNSATMYDIDPKYQSACVKLRSISMMAEGAEAAQTHSTYAEPTPRLTTIRDHVEHGGPARYKPTSDVTLGVEADTPASLAAGVRQYKWAQVGESFQINLENHPDGAVDTSARPAPGTVAWWCGDRWTSTPAVYEGLPADVQAAVIHPEFPHKVLFFKGDSMYTFNLDTTALESTESVATRFPQFTGTIAYAYRSSAKGNNADGEMRFWQFNLFNTDGDKFRWEYAYPYTGAWDFLDTTANHHGSDWTAWSEGWNMIFRETNGVSEVEANPNTGLYVAYGAGTSVYATLPTGIQAAFYDKVNDKSYALKGSTLYELDPTSKTVTATAATGAAVVTDQHMDDGNWSDGSDYTLSIANTAGGTLPVYSYGIAEPVETTADWTITGWGNTVLFGTAEFDSATDRTRLVVGPDAEGFPIYHPFVAGSFTPANVGEAFTGPQRTELVSYAFAGQLPAAGATLTAELLQQLKPAFNSADMSALNATVLRTATHTTTMASTAGAAVAEDGIGTPEVYVRLAGVSMPNNSQNTASEGQSTGPSTILAVAPTVEAYGMGEYSCVSATFQGDVAATGRLIGGTLVNSDFRLELEAPLVLDGDGLPVFGLGPATEAADNSPSGLVHWTAELEVQLLVNAADADDELG
jgi:hypothetical protein